MSTVARPDMFRDRQWSRVVAATLDKLADKGGPFNGWD